MPNVLTVIAGVGRRLLWVVALIRDGESDLAGTYPASPGPTGEQAATQGSVTMSLTGLGIGM